VTGVLDKHGKLPGNGNLVLELGSGTGRDLPDSVTVDVVDHPEVDVVGDVFEVLAAIPAGNVKSVYSRHFLEHVLDLVRLLAEIGRVLTPGGLFVGSVPHWSNPYFWSDPTHVRPFGLYSFSYFTSGSDFRRQVPTYTQSPKLEIQLIRLEFHSPHRGLNRLQRRFLEPWVNARRRHQELFEYHLARHIPISDIRFELRRS